MVLVSLAVAALPELDPTTPVSACVEVSFALAASPDELPLTPVRAAVEVSLADAAEPEELPTTPVRSIVLVALEPKNQSVRIDVSALSASRMRMLFRMLPSAPCCWLPEEASVPSHALRNGKSPRPLIAMAYPCATSIRPEIVTAVVLVGTHTKKGTVLSYSLGNPRLSPSVA